MKQRGIKKRLRKTNQTKNHPNPSLPLLEQAGRLLSMGAIAEALPLVERALQIAPENATAYHMLGFCHLQAGNPDAGIKALRTALQSAPANANILNHLGAALVRVGENGEGIACLKKAVALAPALADARNNLAHALNITGDFASAAREYRAVVAIAPQSIPAWQGLLSALHKSGEYPAALEAATEATVRFPDQSQFFASLGRILIDMRQMDKAEQALRQALHLDPGNGEAANNLGTVIEERGNFQEALTLYRIASECKPDLADAWFNLGTVHEKSGELPAAQKALQQCATLRPTSTRTLAALIGVNRKLCDWQDLGMLVERLRTLVNQPDFAQDVDDVPTPFGVLSLMLGPEEHLRVASAHSRSIVEKARRAGAADSWRPGRAGRADRKIRVAYLSPDFREHPIAQLMAGVIEHHDRKQFEISCWSLGVDDKSPFRERIITAADRFEDLNSIDLQRSVALMRAAQPYIVIDLAGYTAHARPELLALRVAPVQVNYLGFPGSMGASFIDYIIVDPVLADEGDERYYSEKIIRLPHCYQANDDRAMIDPTPMRRVDHGLPEDAVVFCSFSMNYKIDPVVLDAWTTILQGVPDAVLWLYRTDAPAADNIRNEAAKRGVADSRIIFADRLAKAQHLARHRLADLFLDTFAYGAHTTASDALWAGLPVLTLRGDTFARRVGASIVKAAMMPELVMETIDAYIAKAIEIGKHRSEVMRLKGELQENSPQCPLFSTRSTTQQLEEVYRQMIWDQAAAGQ